MAGLQVLGSDKTLRINDFDALGLVQNFNWAPNFNAQDVFELGRTTRLETLMELETSGSFELSSNGNLAGLIARLKTVFNAGTDAFEGFAYKPATASGVNGYSFTQDDLANLRFDAVLHEKTDQVTFNRSTYLSTCYPTSITGRVQANGTASDTVNWSGLYVIGFPSPFHDVRTVPCERTSASTLTLLDPAYTAAAWDLAYVTIDSVPFRTDVTDPIFAALSDLAGPPVSTIITMSAGYVVPVGVVAMATITRKVPTTSWATVHTPDTVGTGPAAVFGIRGFQANVYIAPANATTPSSSEQWLRVQSIDYNVDLRNEALRQIAFNTQGTTIYHRAPTFPLSMTVNATVTETDWADWQAIMNKSFIGANVYDNTYEFSPQALKTEFAVVVHYFTKDGTKIQELIFPDLRVDGMGNRINVGGRGEITWTFRGTAMTVNGFNI